MNARRWRLVVDPQGVTVAGDRFRLRTNGMPALTPESATDEVLGVAESGGLEEAVNELESITRRSYGQYCSVARIMETVGERWALLVVRDLLVAPKRFADLMSGLPGITRAVLSARLSDLERIGVVRPVPEDAAGVRYELTEYGHALDDIVLRLARWGVRALGEPGPGEVVTVDSLIIALRTAFRPEAAAGVALGFELRVRGIVLHAVVEDGMLRAGPGPLPGADLVITAGMTFKHLITGELPAADAAAAGVRVTGDPALLARFTKLFHL
jgi:DNA-binding HxlR family transcriptional regulator